MPSWIQGEILKKLLQKSVSRTFHLCAFSALLFLGEELELQRCHRKEVSSSVIFYLQGSDLKSEGELQKYFNPEIHRRNLSSGTRAFIFGRFHTPLHNSSLLRLHLLPFHSFYRYLFSPYLLGVVLKNSPYFHIKRFLFTSSDSERPWLL